MATFKGFVGQAYQSDSALADAQTSMNLFLEGIESNDGQNSAYLRETPGLLLLQLLPTSPVRGVFIGQNRLFVVAGSKLYEMWAGGTVNTSSTGNTVTWESGPTGGSQFGVAFTNLVGGTITIAGVAYTVATVTSPTSLTLTTSPGNQTGATYTMPYVQIGDVGTDGLPVQIFPNNIELVIVSAGLVWIAISETAVIQAVYPNRYGTVTTVGTAVTWVSGPYFNAAMAPVAGVEPGIIFINTVPYLIASVNSTTSITLATSAGTMATPTPYYAANETAGTGTGAVAIVPVTASQGAALDGVFIVAQPGTAQMNNSAIGDGTTWPPLNFASKQSYPDAINALLADHEELYVFGSLYETEVWQTNAAATAFNLQRDPGAITLHACVAPWTPVALGEGVAWLGGTVRGWTVAYRATGFVPVRVSTHAVEKIWASYPTTADAVAFVYTDEGHEFWQITFPSGNATWVYDATAAAWAQRGWWNGTSWDRTRQMFHGFVFGAHYVGDWSTGAIYTQSTAYYNDNGTQITRQRAAPHLNTEHLWSFFNSFEILTDAAPGVLFTLDWSDDGAQTWHAGLTASANGVVGQATRVIWRRLGRSRDRIFRVTWSAAYKAAIINAYLDVEQGD